MRSSTRVFTAAAALGAIGLGCGGAAPEAKTGGVESHPAASHAGEAPVTVVSANAREKFDSALDAFNGHDKANDWTDASCAETAKLFEAAASSQKFPEATYDAGLAYQRCGDDKEAKSHFQKALEDEPKFHYARAQLALYQYKADGNVDTAIGALEQAVNDANFQNVPALVDLAMFQMQRDSDQIGANCHAKAAGKDVDLADFDCAKLNLQRALAIDDGYMPAFNQLALYYFGSAKKKGAGRRFGRTIATNAALAKRGDVQQLELASLVCSQAVRKSQSYAPIHNTAGLILNELGNVNTAVTEFQAATKLDPQFFEAQMNLAEVNLSFRGFDKAEAAFRKALEMHPNDYDAHLGLALALRGQIDDTNYDKQVAAVQAELDSCKKIDGARPDAYFNEGILTQEYKAKSAGGNGTDKAVAVYHQAKEIFQTFIEKASGKSEYDGAVKKSKERMQDIDDTITFLQAGGPSTPAAPATPPPADASGGVSTGSTPAAGGSPAGAAPQTPPPAGAAPPSAASGSGPASAPAGASPPATSPPAK